MEVGQLVWVSGSLPQPGEDVPDTGKDPMGYLGYEDIVLC